MCTSLEYGRKRLRDAAEIRQDDVYKRLKTLGDGAEFCYHSDNACYKKYTRNKALEKIKKEQTQSSSTDDQQEDLSRESTLLRSTTKPRSAPSTGVDSSNLQRNVCGQVKTMVSRK